MFESKYTILYYNKSLELTFRHIETRKKEFAISDAALAPTSIADHGCNKVTNEFDMVYKFFCGYMLGEHGQGGVGTNQYLFAAIVEALK